MRKYGWSTAGEAPAPAMPNDDPVTRFSMTLLFAETVFFDFVVVIVLTADPLRLAVPIKTADRPYETA